MMADMNKTLTAREVGTILNIPRQNINYYVKKGELVQIKFPHMQPRYNRDSVMALKQKLENKKTKRELRAKKMEYKHTRCDIITHAHELGYTHFSTKEAAIILTEGLYVETFAPYGADVLNTVQNIIRDFEADSIDDYDVVVLYKQEIIKKLTAEVEALV